MGRRLCTWTLLALLVAAPASARAQDPTVEEVTAALSAVKLVSSDQATVLADGLAFRQTLLLPGTAAWSVRLQATPKPGQIAAHGAGPVVGSRPAQAFGAAGTQAVTVPLTAAGRRQIARRKLARLIVRTTFTDALGRRTTATSSVTLRR